MRKKQDALELLDTVLANKGLSRPKFAVAIKIDPYELKKLAAAWKVNHTPDREKILRDFVRRAHGLKVDKKELTLSTREHIKAKIKERFGGIKQFCEQTGMNRNSLNQVFTGQIIRTDGRIVQTLLTTLNIKP